jgi:hypothetical protein
VKYRVQSTEYTYRLPVPDIKKCKPDYDRYRRNGDEKQQFEEHLFIFQVHKEPEHEARLRGSNQKIGEYAPFAHSHLGGLDGHAGENEQREPDQDEGLRADNNVFFLFLHEKYTSENLRQRFAAMTAALRCDERPSVQFHPEQLHRPEQYRHPASGTSGQERVENVQNKAQDKIRHDHQVAPLEAPDPRSQEKEQEQPGDNDNLAFRSSIHDNNNGPQVIR